MHTALKNTSLVVFPEKLKNREGYLLGINVSEFVLVILDVIDLRSSRTSIEETREYLELQPFRSLTEKLVQGVVKIVGHLKKHTSGEEESESSHQFDIWINLEYNHQDDLVSFKGLTMCGYRYNVKANIIFYDSDNFGFFCTEEKQLVSSFQDDQSKVTVDNEHFDVNFSQVLRNLKEGLEEGLPDKQSTDVFDLVCKILNCKSTLLKVWNHIFLNKVVLKSFEGRGDQDESGTGQALTADEDRSSVKRRRVSGVDWELDKIFKFDMGDDDLYNQLNNKVSIDDGDEVFPTSTIKHSKVEGSEQKKGTTGLNFKELLVHLDDQFFSELDLMRANTAKLRPEVKIAFYLMLLLSHYFMVTHLALLKVWNTIPFLSRLFFSTHKQILLSIESTVLMKSKLAQLHHRQPNRLSALLKTLGYIYNSLGRAAIDFVLGLLVAIMIWSFTDKIQDFLSEAQSYIHPRVFKKQLLMIAMNPAGIKLNYTYCGIISKLTHLICIIQNIYLSFLMEHLRLLLYVYAVTALMGFSLFLAFLKDVLNLTIFQMRSIFGFIFLIFMEHTSWFRILWRVMRGQRENKQEARIQEQYYPPHMRYVALLLEVILLTLYPTIIFFWVWSLIIYLASHCIQIGIELLQTIATYFPLGSILASSYLNKLTPRVLQIKHIFKVQEFRIVRRGAYNGWRLADLLSNLKNLNTIKRLKPILTFKDVSILDLFLPYPRELEAEKSKEATVAALAKITWGGFVPEALESFSALANMMR